MTISLDLYTTYFRKVTYNVQNTCMYMTTLHIIEDMIDHRSYTHNLSSCKIKAWKKTQTRTGFKLMTSAIPVECPTNWAIKPTGSWQHLWVRNKPVDGEEYKWIYESSYIWTAKNDMKTWLIIAVIHNLSSCKIKAWKKTQARTGFEPRTPPIPVQCPVNWAIKPTGSWQHLWVCNIVIPVDGEEYKWIITRKCKYLNWREWYEDMIDHRSYTHNLSSCEIKAWKKFRPERDSDPWPLRYRCSALPTELSSQLGAAHIVSL